MNLVSLYDGENGLWSMMINMVFLSLVPRPCLGLHANQIHAMWFACDYHVPLHSRKDLGLVPRPHPQRKENGMVTFMTLGQFLGLAGSILKKEQKKNSGGIAKSK